MRTRPELHEAEDEAGAGCYEAEAKNFGRGHVGLEDLTKLTTVPETSLKMALRVILDKTSAIQLLAFCKVCRHSILTQ